MIVKIDLLPDKYRRAWVQNLLTVLTVLLVLVLAVLLTMIYRAQTEQMNVWKERTAAVDNEVRRYRADIKKMDDLRRSAEELEAQLKELRTFGSVLPFPEGTLAEIQRLVPADVALSAVTLRDTSGGLIQGQSLSYQSITRLLYQINDSEYFAEPRLKSLSLSKPDESGRLSLSFDITFRLTAPDRGELTP